MTFTSYKFLMFWFTLLFFISVARADCDEKNGPEGYADCVSMGPHYDNYQWASCLSNSLIKLRSLDDYFCKSTDAKYCWYPCMLAAFDRNTGKVHEKCKCDEKTQKKVKLPLKLDCYVPTGKNCDWYSECLEQTHACENTNDKYAITYAKHYCNRFGNYYDKFSKIGQKWVDAARKCLQVKLLPFLHPGSTATCKELKQYAFDSHVGCYLTPFKGEPSFCDLDSIDVLLVFWTIKKSFWTDVTESTKGALATMKKCAPIYVGRRGKKLLIFISYVKNKYSELEEFVSDVVDSLAAKLKLDASGIIWECKLSRPLSSDVTGNIPIEMVLAPKKDVLPGPTQYPSVNMDSVITSLRNEIQSGGLADLSTPTGDTTTVLRIQNCKNEVCTSSDMDESTDPKCQAQHGYCQEDSLPCAGSYSSGLCAGPASRRCCKPVDQNCLTEGGQCQFSTAACNGNYVSGLCHGPSYRKCCVSKVCSAGSKEYACKIKKLYDDKKILLWDVHPSGVTDNAFALNNIIDTCNGGRASRSNYSCKTGKTECKAPGGTICLHETLLKYIYNVSISLTTERVHVNEIAGACHSCTSQHYLGRAVDLHISKDKTDTSREPMRKLYQDTCKNMGGWSLDESKHIHCQFKN